MFQFLKTNTFRMLFSFLLGLFIVLIFKKNCIDAECYNYIEPDVKEISSHTYMIKNKCYQFTPQAVEAG